MPKDGRRATELALERCGPVSHQSVSRPPSCMMTHVISSYEQERLNNISKNNERLVTLGLLDAAAAVREPSTQSTPSTPTLVRKRREPAVFEKTRTQPARASRSVVTSWAEAGASGLDGDEQLPPGSALATPQPKRVRAKAPPPPKVEPVSVGVVGV